MRLLPIAIVIAMMSAFVACDDYDDFTANPSRALRFSNDTINFDTVFATVPTVTKTLVVFNDNSKGVRISQVILNQDEHNVFRVNVDGEYLDGTLSGIDVYGKDSIFVFAEATPPDTDLSQQDFAGTLVFRMENGTEQCVPLVGTALKGELHRDIVTLLADTTLTADARHVFYKDLVVAEGVTLRLAPGTTLYFDTSSSLQVYGTLIAEGTLDNAVVLRGNRLGNLFPYLPYDNTVGRWQGVHLHSTSKGNSLTYTDIHSGNYGIRADSTDINIHNSVIHNVNGDALRLLDSEAHITNSQFSNSHGHCVSVYGGDTEMVFCTLAQFYPWQADRGDALFLSDRMLEKALPISRLWLSSCLVTGYADDVIMGDLASEGDINYRFTNSVLRTPAVDDNDHFIDITWENYRDKEAIQGSKHFNVFDTYNFIYDFRPINKPDSVSIAVGAASPADALRYPTDRFGVKRADRPAAGCYEPAVEATNNETH